MKSNFVAVILSGGAGTRLWPLSRRHYPKQFIPLFDDKSLFIRTLERIVPLNPEYIVVVCNEAHRFMVMEYLHSMGLKKCIVIAEPESRNTAPAIALASLWLRAHAVDGPMLVLPSDHYMEEDNFGRYINDEIKHATKDYFITFGIKPMRAETGYGYIKIKNEKLPTNEESTQSDVRLIDVEEFVEKPNQTKAEAYIKSGLYYWNSGIFFFRVNPYLSALQHHQADIYDACNEALLKGKEAEIDGYRIINPDIECFRQSPDISVDYAVMEQLKNIRLCPLDIQWSDLGSWQALSEVQSTDEDGNKLSGGGNIVTEDSKDNIVYANNKLVVCLGINNHLIAETKDAV